MSSNSLNKIENESIFSYGAKIDIDLEKDENLDELQRKFYFFDLECDYQYLEKMVFELEK